MDHLVILELSAAMVAFTLAAWFVLVWHLRPRIMEQNRKGLFRFNDGKNDRVLDPIQILASLEAHKQFRIDLHPRQAENGNRQAMEICVDAVSNAFGVCRFTSKDQPGLTTVEMLRLLQAFEIYCLRVKKNSQPSQISELSSDSISSASSEGTEKHTSVSG